MNLYSDKKNLEYLIYEYIAYFFKTENLIFLIKKYFIMIK
jgi:hypothetical protein